MTRKEKVSRKDAKAQRNTIIGLNGQNKSTQMKLIGADKCIVVSWGRGAPDPRRREIDGAGAPSVPGMINRRLYGCTFTTQYLILHLSVIISRISVSSNQQSAFFS